MIELPRSSYYYASVRAAPNVDDNRLAELVDDIQDEFPGYGYRRVTHQLRRQGVLVNHKRVARVMRSRGLGVKPRRQFVRTTPRMRGLLARTTQRSVVVLSRRYRDQVMCIHQQLGDAPHPVTRYERGVAMPMFNGATSKAILAHQGERTLERVCLENEEQIRQMLNCTNWKAFRDELDGIRRAGVAVTRSEVAEGRVGIAAPVFTNNQVVAGLSLVLHEADLEVERFTAAVIETAREITNVLSREGTWIARA